MSPTPFLEAEKARIKYIQQRYLWDEHGEYGFGKGQIIDTLTMKPVTNERRRDPPR